MADVHLAQTGYGNYYQMLSDKVRMEAYRKAIFKVVQPGDIVVDLGAGTGLLGIWALQAGAARVYAIEKTDAIELAKEIACANGYFDKMVFLNENSVDVELPERANVLLSETLGSFGIDENTLQFTNDARDRFLVDGGVLLPEAIELFVAPVEDAVAYEKIDFWRTIPDVNFAPAFDLFSRKIMVESVNKDGILSHPVSLGAIDFRKSRTSNFDARVYIQMEKPGTIHGVAGWFRVKLCDEIEIVTSPEHEGTHWKQAFFPFRETIEVIKGDVLDWSMRVTSKELNSDDATIQYDYRCTQMKNEMLSSLKQRVGRNEKCPCGSGKKFKNCCMS